MGLLLILLNALATNVEGFFVTQYGKKHGQGGLFFNAIISFFSMIYFIITDKNGFYFPPELWFYGIISCILYAVGFYTMFAAYQYGSFIMTRMISSFAMIIPMVYGFVFLKEPATVFTYIGILLIFASLIVRNIGAEEKKTEKSKKAAVLWAVYVLLTTVANGFISIIKRIQQLRFDDACTNEFLIISLGGSFIALLIASIIKERKNMGYIVRNGTFSGLCAGMCNGIANFTSVAVYLFLPMSLVSPLTSGIGFAVSFLFTIFIYKEKFTKQQLLGVILGIAAIIILKL